MVYCLIVVPSYSTDFCPCRRRTLDDAEKNSYITAVKCMQSRPALHDHGEAVRTRFDEFQALHIDVADRVHGTVSHCWRTITVREILKSITRVNSFLGIDVTCKRTRTHCGLSVVTMEQRRTFFCRR